MPGRVRCCVPPGPPPQEHKRRKRYSGRNPRSFEDRVKERSGDGAVLAKIEAKGNTAVGTHRPICVKEIVEALLLHPGSVVVDCTLGYGGHAAALLPLLDASKGGLYLAFDADAAELSRTQHRLQSPALRTFHSNYAAAAKHVLALVDGADALLADLGVSSMQLDAPNRGFSLRHDGPLDMRMDQSRGLPASQLFDRWSADCLADLLEVNADEPRASELAAALLLAHSRSPLQTTRQLADAVAAASSAELPDVVEQTTRRVFQAIRIAVNDEFSKLDALLTSLPFLLKPGGRAAFLTFHSGEDRRVKKAFKQGLADGLFSDVAPLARPTMEEQRANSRSKSAKLRVATRAS